MATPMPRGLLWLFFTAMLVAMFGFYGGRAGLIIGVILACAVVCYLIRQANPNIRLRFPRKWRTGDPDPKPGMTRGYSHPDLRYRLTFYAVVVLLAVAIVAGCILRLEFGIFMALSSGGGYIIGRICYGARHDQQR